MSSIFPGSLSFNVYGVTVIDPASNARSCSALRQSPLRTSAFSLSSLLHHGFIWLATRIEDLQSMVRGCMDVGIKFNGEIYIEPQLGGRPRT